MKNLFSKVMLFAVAAMAFVSCTNDSVNETPATKGFEASISAKTTETTRSAFGDYNETSKTYPTLWEGTEKWFAAINNRYTEAVESITFSNDKKSATGTVTLQEAPTASSEGTYNLYALSPASAWSSYDLDSDYLRFYIARNTQTPTETSCDPASQVLFAKSGAMQSADSFDVDFAHLSAYIKFSFTNVAEGGVVSSVTISSEDVNLAGRYQYTLSTGALKEHDRLEKSITLVTDKTENLWVAVAPVDVSGKTLTFTITTDKGALTREVPMPATAKFESGKVVTFNVNMADIDYPAADAGETWQLVTDVADVTDGEYIIVAKNNEDNIVYLPSTTTTSAAPSQKVINVTGLDLSSTDEFKTTLIPAEARFTFSGSASKMTITNAEGKYLYTTSSNNGLRISTTNGNWSIAKHDKNDKSLTLKFNTTSRFIALYNAQDWRSYTAVYDRYTGSNTTQNGVTFLYKKITNDPTISANAIEVAATGGDGESSYTVKNMEDDVTATYADDWIIAEAGDGIILYEVEPNYTGAVRTGKITLSSEATGVTKDVTVTQAADEFKVSATTVSLDAEANSTATFTVTTTYDATIAVDDSAKWSVDKASVNAGTTTITVTAKTANAGAEAVEGTITVTRTADSKVLSVAISQNAQSTGGGGVPVGTTLFEETWGTYTGAVASYTFTGTTVYGNVTTNLSYSVTNTEVKVESTTASPITTNNCFFDKSGANSLTLSGINLHGASSVTVSYVVNRTNMSLSYSIDGGSSTSLKTTSTKGSNTATITTNGGTSLTLTFKDTSTTANIRLDDIKVVVAE